MRVLIVDDNDRMRQLIRGLITDLAEEIDERSDGAQALTAYAASRPDWVLMDLSMKDVNGLTATRQIRAAFPAVKIIIVTSYDDPYLRQEALSAGACGYVVKANLLELRRLLTESSGG
ncbi:MAG: response regulator transcription factor [Planctomycetes bacterium]|nr:response regulator transcription factor [Planctomycetota bacterium]